MTSAGTIWHVARREVVERGRSKAYLITSAVTLLIVIGLIVAPSLLSGGTTEYQVGSVGTTADTIIDAAQRLGNAADEPGDEPSVALNVTPFDSVEGATAALENGVVDVVLVEGAEVIVRDVSGFGGSDLLGLLQRGAASVELETLTAENGQAAADVIQLLTSDPLETTVLSGQEPGDESSAAAAYAGLLLLYMAILLYGTWILQGVTEEKSNRVVEVLLSSVRPWQLLAGKIAGIGLLGIAQFAGTVIVAFLALTYTKTIELPTVEVSSVITLIIWFVLGFLLYAMMFGTAGSLASRMEDAQTVAFPMSMVAVASFFVSIVTLEDPNGLAAVIGTFIPLSAPFVVPVRAAFDAIPLWQYGLSIVVTIAAIVGLTAVAGRIYAGALLRFGGRTKLREAWRTAVE